MADFGFTNRRRKKGFEGRDGRIGVCLWWRVVADVIHDAANMQGTFLTHSSIFPAVDANSQRE